MLKARVPRDLVCGLVLGAAAVMTAAAPISYATEHLMAAGGTPAVIVEKATKVLPRPN